MADDKGKLAQAITLDASLDDIEDLPDFVVPPSGAYSVIVDKIEQKEINDQAALEFAMKITGVLELSESLPAGENPPKEGDLITYSYMLGNKFGVGNMKKMLAPIGTKLETTKLSEIVNQMQGMQLMIVNRRTYDKAKDRHYANIKKIEVL